MANEFVVKNGLIVSGSARVQGSVTAQSFTGSFSGSIATAVTASYALTASSVTTLNQTVIITGSLGVGVGSLGSTENTLVLGPAPAGGSGEGGQVLLQAQGGTYTSASMLDNYQNKFRVLRGTNASSDGYKLQLDLHTGQIQLPNYNSTSAFTGTTLVGFLGFDSSGNLLTSNTSSTALSGGSTNYVARWASSIALTTGSIYDTGTNVGIGTTNPSGKLHIADDGPNALKIGDTQVSTIGETNDGSYPGMKIVPYNSNIHIGISSTNDNKINLWHGGSNYTYWQQTSTYSVISNYYTDALVFQVNGGNVGIGITNPAYKLDVIGNTRVYGSYLVVDQTSGYNTSIILNQSGTIQWYMTNQATTGKLVFGNGNGDLVWIGTTGNVGIGTSSPGYKLDVSGTGKFSGDINLTNSGEHYLQNDASTTFIGLNFDSPYIRFAVNNTERMRIISTGNVGIGTNNPNEKLHVAGNIHAYAAGGIDAGLFASTSGGSTTTAIRSNGITHFNGGNVGIGTTNPNALLVLDSGEPRFRMNIAGTNHIIMNHDGTTAVLRTESNTPFAFGTNGSERMRIAANGNVGIGTTNPVQILHVNGNIYMPSTNYITWNNGDSEIGGLSSGYGIRLSVYDGSATMVERMRIISSGNVGIGTTNPVYKLQVVGSTYINGGTLFLDSSQYLRWGNSTQGIVGVNDTSLDFLVGSAIRMTATAGGNVGIGVTTPQAKLQVSGSTNVLNVRGSGSATTSSIFSVDGNNGRLFEVSDDLSNSLFSVNTIAGLPVIEAFADYTVTMGTYGQYVLQVTGSNVGIGSSAPGAKLDVNGNVRATSFTGSFSGSATNAVSASYALTASYALNAGDSVWTGSAGNIYYNGGNVGIGVASPTATLSLGASAYDSNPLTGLQYTQVTGGGRLDLKVQTWGTTSNYGLTTGLSVVTPGFDTADVRVGIGTTNPSQKLVVVGNTAISGVTYTDYVQTYSGTSIDFRHQDASVIMRVDTANARVGIGITSPNTQLHLFGTGDQAITIQSSTTGASTAAFIKHIRSTTGSARSWWTGVGIQGGTDDSYSFYDATAGAERMRITGTGYVGIGTTNPQNKLVVTSDATYNSENSYSIAAASATNPDFKTVIGYDYANDIGVIAAVRMGVAWKNLAILPTGGSNVGIGTTNPTAKLHVVGSTYTVGTIGIQGTNVFYFDDYGGGWYMQDTSWIRTYNAKSIWTAGGYLGTDGGLTVGYGGTGSPSGGAIIAGNVGIGSSSPGYKLDVVGTARITSGLYVDEASTGAGSKQFFIGGGSYYNFFVGKQYNVNNAFEITPSTTAGGSTYSTPALAVLYNGNIGINTTNPTEKFHVIGTGKFTDSLSLYPNWNSGTLAGNSFYAQNSTDGFGFGVGTGISTWWAWSNTSGISRMIDVENDGGYITLRTSNSDRVTINSSGNVGIGTTSPADNLHIFGTGDQIIKIENSGTYLMYAGLISNEGYIGSTNATPLGFYTNNVNRMYINTSGNVGIGTTNPAAKLDVSTSTYGLTTNSVILQNASGDTRSVGQFLGDPNAYNVVGAYGTNTVSGSIAGIKFNWYSDNWMVSATRSSGTPIYGFVISKNGSEKLVIGTDGNVGIGTTSPGEKLSVNGTFSSNSLWTVGAAISFWGGYPTAYGGLTWDTGQATVYATSGNKLYLASNGSSPDMTIDTSGNVGIGITTPSVKLEVDGIIRNNSYIDAGTSGAAFRFYDGSTFRGGFGTDAWATGGSSSNLVTYLNSGNYYIITDGTNNKAVTVDSSGCVGIGTTSPAAKLDIAGNAVIQNGYNMVIGSTVANPVASTSKAALTLRKFTSGNASTVVSASYYLGVGGNEYTIGSYRLIGFGYAEQSATTTYPAYIGYKEASTSGYTYGDLIFGTRATYGASDDPSERMRITYDGNVGIGTTSPAVKLHVVGGIVRIDSNTGGFYQYNTSGVFRSAFYDDGTVTSIYGDGDGSNPAITINSGNVGIGTTSPDVYSFGGGRLLTVSDSSTYSVLVLASGGTNSGGISMGNQTIRRAAIDHLNGSHLVFYTNGSNSGTSVSERMRIASDGNIGIGSTSPAAKLDIVGTNSTVALSFGNTVPNNPLFINTYGGWSGIGMDQATAGLRLAGDYSSGTSPLVDIGYYSSATVGHANWVNRFRVLNNGNVGIGTTAPSQKFVVSNGSAEVFKVYSTGEVVAGTNYIYAAYSSGTSFYAQGAASFRDGIHNDTSTYLKIDGGTSGFTYFSGNVGIGSTSPAFKLDVNGNAAIGTKLSVGTTYNGFTANIAGTTYIIGASAWVNDGYGYANADSPTTGVFPTSGNDVNINTLGSTSLKVKVGGFVGIGTTNPVLPLDVVGTVRATTFIETSARKYKTNIQNLEPQLNKVLQLQPVTFDWKDKKQENSNIGLIADDVINIYPEFVVKNSEDEIEGIDYSKLTAVLIQSVKELKEIIDVQQQQINTLLNK